MLIESCGLVHRAGNGEVRPVTLSNRLHLDAFLQTQLVFESLNASDRHKLIED